MSLSEPKLRTVDRKQDLQCSRECVLQFLFFLASANAVPHYTNAEFPTFGEMAGTSTSGAQRMSLALGKLPSQSWYLPWQLSIAVSSMHLKLRKEHKEDYIEGGRKQGGDWVIG